MLALPVTYSTIFDVERSKSLEEGKPLELECDVADTTLPVHWYKDGVRLFPQNGWDMQSVGTLRRLVIPSAELLHSGFYSCETPDDTVHFPVDIKGDTNSNTTKSRRLHTTILFNHIYQYMCVCFLCYRVTNLFGRNNLLTSIQKW